MPVSKKKIRVEVPHRRSGFFEIVDQINGIKIEEAKKIESRGAGQYEFINLNKETTFIS